MAAGRLQVGDRLPSVRELAASALVNPNTVARAWRDLERERILDTQPGRGVFVAQGAARRARTARDREMRHQVERLVGDAMRAGLPPDQLVAWVVESTERQPGRKRTA